MATITSVPVFNTLWDPGAITAPYDFFACKIKILWDSHKLQIPIAQVDAGGYSGEAAPGMLSYRKACEIIQTAAPTGLRIVAWGAQRNGVLPYVPNPDPQDSNQVLLSAEIETSEPKLLVDGINHVYQVAGIYVYALKKPIWTADSLNMGKSAADQTPAAYNIFNASFFVYGIQSALKNLK